MRLWQCHRNWGGLANCRHSFWPFIEGISERTYTDAELEGMKPENRPKTVFEGREYDDYQATQMQRRVEREIRKQKRLKTAYESAGLTDEATAANIRLRRLNEKYREFSRAAGLPEQRERMKVSYVDDASAKKAAGLLEKKAESGIINLNGPKEIPEMPKTAAPRRQAEPIDVTKEYLENATPNSHIVQDLQSYTVNGVTYAVDGHNVVLDYSPHEKEIAELLERKLGGEIFMVPRVNEPQGISTPDYLFRGERFDLKSPKGGGKNTLYDAIAKKAAQAENFVFDLSKCPLSDEEVERQLTVICTSTHTKFVNLIIAVKNGEITKILRRKN